ncbi:MAG: hypothetical protein R3B91_09415 [Planctomycetaceae bacterium]
MAKKSVRRVKNTRQAPKSSKVRKASTKAAPKQAVKKKPAAKRVAKKVSKTKKNVPAKRKAVKRPVALGRPRVPGTADLDRMFRNDYEARQVFEFLKVKTVKELEEHSPEIIIHELTAPLMRTVERIRKALAVNNRFLAGDQKFAVEFIKQIR